MPLRSPERRVVGCLYHYCTKRIGFLIGPVRCVRVVRGLHDSSPVEIVAVWRAHESEYPWNTMCPAISARVPCERFFGRVLRIPGRPSSTLRSRLSIRVVCTGPPDAGGDSFEN
jgi:hypothetical protein